MILYRTQHPHLYPSALKKFIKQCYNGCFTICSRNTNQFHFLRWLSIKIMSHQTGSCCAIFHLYIGDPFLQIYRQDFTYDRDGL